MLQGLSILAIVMLLYVGATVYGQSENQARSLTFSTLVIANLCLIISNRSWTDTFIDSVRRSNRAFWYVSAGAIAFLAAAIYLPPLQAVFLFAPLSAFEIIVSIAAGLSSLIVFETLKINIRHSEHQL